MTLTLLEPANAGVALTANQIASKIANPEYNERSKALYALVFNSAVETLNAEAGAK